MRTLRIPNLPYPLIPPIRVSIRFPTLLPYSSRLPRTLLTFISPNRKPTAHSSVIYNSKDNTPKNYKGMKTKSSRIPSYGTGTQHELEPAYFLSTGLAWAEGGRV